MTKRELRFLLDKTPCNADCEVCVNAGGTLVTIDGLVLLAPFNEQVLLLDVSEPLMVDQGRDFVAETDSEDFFFDKQDEEDDEL